MNIILFIVFIILFSGNGKDRKNSDLFKWLLKLYIGITVLGWFIPSPVLWIAAIAMIVFVAKKKAEDSKQRQSHQKPDYDRMKREWEQRNRQNAGQTADRTSGQNSGQHTAKSSQAAGVKTGTQGTYGAGGSQKTGGQEAGRASKGSQSQYRAYQSSQTSYNTQGSYAPYTASKILPKPLMRRNRIISTFNDRYDLSLTEAEINRIAEASYVSEAWKREVESMTAKYETEGQWFVGPTDWLRVYIYVFYQQNISSDFTLQEQICFETLDEVMAYGCAIPDATVEERIRRINDRYFTRFNEMTFMIVYRFLQRKGRNYKLSRPDLVKNVDQELEEALKKYQTAGAGR